MWVAEHEDWCDEQSHFEAGMERVVLVDQSGDILDSYPDSDHVIWARCNNCKATASWKEDEGDNI